jgi:predicted metal-dependent hydrolase
MALLMDHADWVTERLAALPGAVAFEAGAVVPLHGVDHLIRHVTRTAQARLAGGVRRSSLVWVERGEIRVAGDGEFLARRVAEFLRAEARRRMSALVAQKAAMAAVQPRRITVKDTRSRWGSCAANSNLAFSWRLVMAPRFVQDYVAAHEVAHLRHMNHGPRFWALVDELTPHTEAAMVWLRTQGPALLRVG